MTIKAVAKVRCLRPDSRRGKMLQRRIVARAILPVWMQPDRIYHDRTLRPMIALEALRDICNAN